MDDKTETDDDPPVTVPRSLLIDAANAIRECVPDVTDPDIFVPAIKIEQSLRRAADGEG